MPRRAFTLLETLLAISLLAVVAAVALSMLAGGSRARRVVAEGSLQTRSMVLTLDEMARRLESAMPPTSLLAGEFIGQADTEGRNDTLTLHTVVDPHGTGWGDVQRTRFFVDLDQDTPCLMVGQTANLLSPTAPVEEVSVLCRSVASFKTQYFDGDEWLDSWSSSDQGNSLPAAVRLTLRLEGDHEDDAPEQAATMERVVLLPCAAQGGST